MLPEVRSLLSTLDKHKSTPKAYGVGPGEYYDDLCLARFLEGVCLRYVAYPVGVFFLGGGMGVYGLIWV